MTTKQQKMEAEDNNQTQKVNSELDDSPCAPTPPNQAQLYQRQLQEHVAIELTIGKIHDFCAVWLWYSSVAGRCVSWHSNILRRSGYLVQGLPLYVQKHLLMAADGFMSPIAGYHQ